MEFLDSYQISLMSPDYWINQDLGVGKNYQARTRVDLHIQYGKLFTSYTSSCVSQAFAALRQTVDLEAHKLILSLASLVSRGNQRLPVGSQMETLNLICSFIYFRFSGKSDMMQAGECHICVSLLPPSLDSWLLSTSCKLPHIDELLTLCLPLVQQNPGSYERFNNSEV